jgi:hypothetical protein
VVASSAKFRNKHVIYSSEQCDVCAWHISRLDRKLSVLEHEFAVDGDCGSVDHEVPVD